MKQSSSASAGGGEKREKRQVELASKRRQFNLDRLINKGEEGSSLSRETLAKARGSSAYANPNHVEPELWSQGLEQQVKRVSWYRIQSKQELEKYNLVHKLGKLFRGSAGKEDKSEAREKEEPLADKVFFDHRDSNCMWTARDQGDCGSCYAFAWTALAEWAHCKATGELLAFSEQYIVDCGKYAGTFGCGGGAPFETSTFIHNFGVELRKNYPYLSGESECPYDEDTDLKTTGYIRMDLQKSYSIPMDRWAELLPLSPMYVSISTEGGFHEYGGGVYDGAGCRQDGGHAVVLIGHGREDGQEYWLIRNSHSNYWGEGGYMKLAKDSNCISPKLGRSVGLEASAFGAKKPVSAPKVAKNTKYNAAKIQVKS